MNLSRAASVRIARKSWSTGSLTTKREASKIILKALPRTALPSDLMRVVSQFRLQGVRGADLIYDHFLPTGSAELRLANPKYLPAAIDALQGASLGSIPFQARPSYLSEETNVRARGAAGRANAADRGALQGNGIRAGLGANARHVLVLGLPASVSVAGMKKLLRDFDVTTTADGEQEVYKLIEEYQKTVDYSSYSRFLVRLTSKTEAHRVVRRLHMTYYHPEEHKHEFEIRARVIY